MVKAKIMIVEDEGITGHFIQKTLETLGYMIISVEKSGESALKKISESKPDLVLMDIKLNGAMDGIETAEEIKDRFSIPVVYLTAHSDDAMLERAKITEPFGYVIKPFEERELHSNIEMALYKHKAEKKIIGLAYYDMLTGLPNRNLFFDRLNQYIKQAKRSQESIALLMIDLDGFKCVNDRMGHDAGDHVLKEVALRLKETIREADTVARMGGDEFIIVVTNLLSPADAASVATKAILSIGKPFNLKSLSCAVGASIGISLYPDDGTDNEILLRKADIAMYRAKENGKNRFFFFNDIYEKTAVGILGLVTFALDFVLQKNFAWNHNDWVNFLLSTEKKGLHVTKDIETNLGLLSESLKKLFQLMPESDINHVSFICRRLVQFVRENKGFWLHPEWETLLKTFESGNIKMSIAGERAIGELVKNIKSLYTLVGG
ncbi:MAG: diguanylate cyclase [Nitrospirae bacterium YQR-1]